MTTKPYMISWDPGESTGWCSWHESGALLATGTTRSREELYKLLDAFADNPPQVFVVEDWKLFKHKAVQQSGSKQETVRVIGVLDEWARQKKVTVVKQPSSLLPTTQLQSGVRLDSNHKNSHWQSAYNHGFHYLVQKGVLKLK